VRLPSRNDMANKSRLRVYFITHHDGRLTGRLLRHWSWWCEKPAPAAYGVTRADVLRQLEHRVHELQAEDPSAIERYLWEEALEPRVLTVEIHPQVLHRKLPIIGQGRVPLRLTYLAGRVGRSDDERGLRVCDEDAPWRILVPRFEWSFVVEDVSIAREVLSQAVSTVLVGEQPRSLYDFRSEGEEFVVSWEPKGLREPERAARAPRERWKSVEAVAEDLSQRARTGKLPPLVMDEEAIRPLLPRIEKYPPDSLLLVGGSGVGKTAWVMQLARVLADRAKEKKTAGTRVWRTSADRILAGMAYLGMWQERCLQLVEELSFEGDYLYVDRLASLIAPQSDGTSIAELLAPAVAGGEMSLIAECTEEELERCERRAPDVVGLFRVVRLRAPTVEEMSGLVDRYLAARRSPVGVTPAAKARLVSLLDQFQRDLLFPGKAYRFIDGVIQRAGKRARTLDPMDVAKEYALASGLPLEILSNETRADRMSLARGLQQGVIGQDHACEVCASVLARLKAGLNDPEKPVGVFLFAGPTGVGKTELAKRLARTLFGAEDRLIRLDMSE